jgi:dihydroxyacetone kinase DhaKLM complex PTS-EIIA-like component DhaM
MESRSNAPASYAEAREQELVGLAYDAVEERIRSGKASAMELVYFLKIGSARERLDTQATVRDMQLKQAKIDNLKSAESKEKLYSEAVAAMQGCRYDG